MFDSTEILNLTIGVSKTGLLGFVFGKNGSLKPSKRPISEMFDILDNYGNFNIELAVTDEGRFGTLTENGYESGVLGMMERGEIDISWYLYPLETPKIPGKFSQVIENDEYRLASYYSQTVIQDVTFCFTSFDPTIWNSVELINNCIQKLPSQLSFQYFPDRSLIRSSQIIGIMFLTFLVGASFNTNIIIGTRDKKLNTLRDIVDQDKIPIFIEGMCQYEFFKDNVTEDFRDVYRLAVVKGSNEQFGAKTPELISMLTKQNVVLVSIKMREPINIFANLFNSHCDLTLHWSYSPYSRSMKALIVTNKEGTSKLQNRVMKLIDALFQADLYKVMQYKYKNYIMNSYGLSFLNPDAISTDRNKMVSNLSYEAFKSINQYYCVLISFTISMFAIELVVNKIMQLSLY